MAATTLVVGLTLGLLAAWPVEARYAVAGVLALGLGLMAAVVGGWVGTALTLMFLSRTAQEQATGILLGLIARFFVTITLIGVGMVSDIAPRGVFLVAAAVGQLLILAIDTAGLAKLVRQAGEGKAA